MSDYRQNWKAIIDITPFNFVEKIFFQIFETLSLGRSIRILQNHSKTRPFTTLNRYNDFPYFEMLNLGQILTVKGRRNYDST